MAPALKVAVKLRLDPAQSVVVPPAVGALGTALTVTFVVPAGPVQPLNDIVAEYVPLADVVAAPMVGFCADEVKELGPVQFQVVPPLLEAVKLRVEPTHKGELLERVGAEGVVTGETTTVFTIAGQLLAVSLISTVYVPIGTLTVLVLGPVDHV